MGIEFKTAAHRYVYERVKPLLEGREGLTIEPAEDHPAFTVSSDDVYGFVAVAPMQELDAIVRVAAFVASGADVSSPELRRFLLQQNFDRSIGAFYIDEEGCVVLSYSMLGSTLEVEDIATALHHVLNSASEVGDHIVDKWGGVKGPGE